MPYCAARRFGRNTRRQRPGTYQAHLAAEHINQLWQLIEAVAPDEAANRGHARILFHFEDVALFFICMSHMGAIHVGVHGAKFEEHEVTATPAHAGRLIENGALRG